MKNKNIVEIISVLLILLFVYTAVSKIINYSNFKYTIDRVDLVKPLAGPLSIFVPTAELIVSFLLLTPSLRKWGLYGSFLLMLMFTIYVGYIIYFAPYRPCSCGGIITKMTWRQHLIFNTVFTILSLIGIRLHGKQKAKSSPVNFSKSNPVHEI